MAFSGGPPMEKDDEQLRVLVVEDEPDTAEMLAKMIRQRYDATVETANTITDAREKLATGTYDVMTLDYQLPDGTGLDLFEWAREMTSCPAVVMITGHGDESTAVKAFHLGASGYVVKDTRLPAMLRMALNKITSEIALERAERRAREIESEFLRSEARYISALKKGEEELREKLALLDAVIATSGDMIAVVDTEGRMILSNEAARRMDLMVRGGSNESLTSDSDEVPVPIKAFYQVVETLEPVTGLEGDVRRLDGGTTWFSVNASALLGEEGELDAVAISVRDITHRREYQQAIVEILGGIPAAIFVVDSDGKMVYTNDDCVELLGSGDGSDLAVGEFSSFYSVYLAGTDETYPVERAPITIALREGRACYINDAVIRKPEGEVPIEISAKPIFDGDGRVKYAVAMFKDMSDGRVGAVEDIPEELG